MLKNVIGIDGRDFLLTSNTDMAALKLTALEAIRGGGGFLELDVVGHVHISVIISAGVSVVFESQNVDYETLLDDFMPSNTGS